MEQKAKAQAKNQPEEIDLLEIASLLWSKIKVIIICFLVGALVAGGYTKIIVTPQYTATSMIYILGETTSITSVANLQLSSELTADFSMLAKRRKVIEKVNKDLNLGKTYEELCNVITIANPTDTHILTISVTDPDPEIAKDIANAMAEAVADNLSTVMATEKPSIAEEAVTPKAPSSPNTTKNCTIITPIARTAPNNAPIIIFFFVFGLDGAFGVTASSAILGFSVAITVDKLSATASAIAFAISFAVSGSGSVAAIVKI